MIDMLLFLEMKEQGRFNKALWFGKEKKIKKLNIFYCLCIDELKCPDLIEKQNPINKTSPGKELMEKWIFTYCY